MLSYQTLDAELDIEYFLSLKDEFYFLFAKNKDKAVSSWNAGGIPVDCQWNYITENPFLYYTLHKNQDPKFTEFDNKEQLAVYLQLKYGSFNPYRILHLVDYTAQKNIESWVTEPIKKWIQSLPFSRIDSVSFFYNDHYCPLKFHRDFNFLPYEKGEQAMPDTVQDLIWFRFDLDREFFLYNISEDGNIVDQLPVQGYSATFNHFNWHGNIDSYDKASLTVKVEGKFSKEFRND
jgi:hypothetical protein